MNTYTTPACPDHKTTGHDAACKRCRKAVSNAKQRAKAKTAADLEAKDQAMRAEDPTPAPAELSALLSPLVTPLAPVPAPKPARAPRRATADLPKRILAMRISREQFDRIQALAAKREMSVTQLVLIAVLEATP